MKRDLELVVAELEATLRSTSCSGLADTPGGVSEHDGLCFDRFPSAERYLDVDLRPCELARGDCCAQHHFSELPASSRQGSGLLDCSCTRPTPLSR